METRSSIMSNKERQPRFQFNVAVLLAGVTVASVSVSSIACGGLCGTLIGLPLAAAAIAVEMGVGSRGLRRICLLLAVCGVLLFLLLAGASYPIIVIADSDLGASAMAHVGDWLQLSGVCVLAAVLIVIGNFITSVPAEAGVDGWTAGLDCFAAVPEP